MDVNLSFYASLVAIPESSMKRRRPKSKSSRRRSGRRLTVESLENRRLLAANSLGVTHLDTGEFLLGSVAVTPVLFESNGTIDPESQNWTSAEIDEALAKIGEGVNWWSDTLDQLNTVHSISFVHDNTFALSPFETAYEPIDRISNNFNLYVGEFLHAQGFGNVSSIEEGMKQFNAHQREQLGTDWAFTIFMVDSSDDADGQFLSGGFFQTAFAYAGGLFVVTPSTRPASTIAHEMGHIFWARDEYPGGGSWTDRRGYYNAQNLNAADNPTSGFVQEDSIMSGGIVLANAYAANESPDSTLAMVGWRDTDGDGIFDLADVPLELTGEGYFDAASSNYRFSGSASAVPLVNQNSSGPQSDITLNRVSRLQYRLDGGSWITASQPDQQKVDFDLSIPIGTPFSSIQWRAVDDTTGVTSAVIDGGPDLPAFSQNSGSGIVFLDDNNDGQRDSLEAVLGGTTVAITNGDGSDIVFNQVQAANYPPGFLPSNLPNVTLTSQHPTLNVVSVGDSSSAGVRIFQQFDSSFGPLVLRDSWTQDQPLNATFDLPVGEVTVDVIGATAGSYVRVEARDALGNLLQRTTSDLIASGASDTVRVIDPLGRIASVQVFGHAESQALITGVSYGTNPVVTSGNSGGWAFENLPIGQYNVELTPELLIHQFDQGSFTIDVTASGGGMVQSAASRVDSPRYNTVIPEDVNASGDVTVLDALEIINDIARDGARILQAGETSSNYVDVSNDGRVSSFDALLVLNQLSVISGGGEGELASFSIAAGTLNRSTMDSGSGQEFEALAPCHYRVDLIYPERGVLNYDDSRRGSESIGGKNADTPLYGPLQQVADVGTKAVFLSNTVDVPVGESSEPVDLELPNDQLDSAIDPQLSE